MVSKNILRRHTRFKIGICSSQAHLALGGDALSLENWNHCVSAVANTKFSIKSVDILLRLQIHRPLDGNNFSRNRLLGLRRSSHKALVVSLGLLGNVCYLGEWWWTN